MRCHKTEINSIPLFHFYIFSSYFREGVVFFKRINKKCEELDFFDSHFFREGSKHNLNRGEPSSYRENLSPKVL